MLLQDYNFPVHAPALLAVDYLQRIPVVGVTGMVSEERRGGKAAAMLHSVARRQGWAVIAASAFEEHANEIDLQALFGHTRLETTGRYLHPTAERMQKAVEGL